MTYMETKLGSKVVKSTNHSGVWQSRLYVEGSATLVAAQHKRQTAAVRWAHRVLLGM